MPPKRNPNASLQQQINQLSALVAKMSTQPLPRKKKRAPRRRQSEIAMPANQAGTARFRRTEFLKDLKLPASKNEGNGKITINTSSFAWLGTVAKSFDKIIWHSCKVEYRPFSSAMNSGSVAVGVDWDYGSKTDRSSVLACTPSFETPVYKGRTMSLPPSMLMSRKTYKISDAGIDGGPGQLIWQGSSDKNELYCGDLFITYDVTLSGTSGA
ncbi:MAG: putative capsid protein [Thassos sobemo-like virus]|nr:MAG: putative capsid protein [Thassos sobemo-like virus]